jgi:hypothetical protein
MKTVRLGRSGLELSAVVLGMMGYGDPGVRGPGSHAWTVGIEEARLFIRRAYEALTGGCCRLRRACRRQPVHGCTVAMRHCLLIVH